MTGGDLVVLVDPLGTVLGSVEKLRAHEPPGTLHLAISVILYRQDGKMLLQQRSAAKYHFPMRWANACCSHPFPGEPPLSAAKRRVSEELGIQCELQAAGSFIYRAVCPSTGLVEHELDHVMVGWTEIEPNPNALEVAAVKWCDRGEINDMICDGTTVPWLDQAVQIAEDLGSMPTG